MEKLFLFDFDDTLANFSIYNSWALKFPVRLLPPIGGLIEGVPEVLDFLVSKGDSLHLLTMNMIIDENVKWKKLERVGINRWFPKRNISMVRLKTPEVIRGICRGRDPDRCILVGNSLKYDIRPALESGLKAVYIPRPLATRWVPKRVPRDRRLFTVRDIREIKGIYGQL